VKPQRTRCSEWWIGGQYPRPVHCDRPITHRVVGRRKTWPGWPQRELMCEQHAARLVAGNGAHSLVHISAYRVRKVNP